MRGNFFLSQRGHINPAGQVEKMMRGKRQTGARFMVCMPRNQDLVLALRCHWFRLCGCGEPAEPSRLRSLDPQMYEELVMLVTCADGTEISCGERAGKAVIPTYLDISSQH